MKNKKTIVRLFLTVANAIPSIYGFFYFIKNNINFNRMNYNYIFLAVGIICFLVILGLWIHWIIKDYIKKLKNEISSLKQFSYNHANHIMYIEKCFKKESELLEEDKYLIDRNELGGVSYPANKEFIDKVMNEIKSKL